MEMKKLFKGLALGVMFTLTTAAFAGEGDAASVKVSVLPYLHTDYSVLSVSNYSEKGGLFLIEDKSGSVLYKEWVGKSGITQKVLDFSYLKDGDYDMVLKIKGEEKVRKSFSVKDQKLVSELAKKAAKSEEQSFVNLVDNMLYVSHLAFGSNAFAFSISKEGEGEVYSNTIKAKDSYSGKFDVSELPSGKYAVNINSGDKDYEYEFNK